MAGPSSAPQDSTPALSELQAQLRETQISLAAHVERVHSLESILAEHDAIKREVSSMRDLMEERKREIELLRIQSQSPNHLRRHSSRLDEGTEAEFIGDDDDARSVSTIIPHELERVDEEDEEQLAAEEEEEERRRRRDELGRPRTPEPSGLGMDDEEQDSDQRQLDNSHLHAQSIPPSQSSSSSSSSSPPSVIPDDLIQRMNTLTNQLESALELSRSLEAQHHTAQSTISQLESKVSALESMVQTTQSQVQAQTTAQQEFLQTLESKQPSLQAVEEERTRERESLVQILNDWKSSVEGQWSSVREEWSDERERLKRAKEEFESKIKSVEDNMNSAATKVESGLASLTAFQVQFRHSQSNGSAKINGGGLVTPPSPRSISVASSRPRQRKRRPSSSRGRTRSRSISPQLNGRDDSPASPISNDLDDSSSPKSMSRRRLPWMNESSSDLESETPSVNGIHKSAIESFELHKAVTGLKYPITPEPSLHDQPVTGIKPLVVVKQEDPPPKEVVSSHLMPGASSTFPDWSSQASQQPPVNNVSTIVGLIAVGVAVLAVAYRVKPDVAG